MKILMLQDDLYEYLTTIVRAYAHGGIDPEEGLGIYYLNQAIKGAQNVDDTQVAKVQTGETNSGIPVAAVSVEAAS